MKRKMKKLLAATYPLRICLFAIFFLFCLGGGYGTLSVTSDLEKSEENVFQAGEWGEDCHLVINEVFYDVDNDHGDDGGNQSDEWVEIYNPCDVSINLKDYGIEDNSGTERTISNSNLPLGPGIFAVLAKAAQTWTLWTIPADVEKVSLGAEIGNGLANSGDRVILKDADGIAVDAMSYGDDKTVLDPACQSVAEGHSLEREPDGNDNGQSSDFKDGIVPTPGL